MKTAYANGCDFALAIVKGLVEHDDGHAYFGSSMAYTHFEAIAIARGHVVRGPKEFDGGGGTMFLLEASRLTDAGRAVYAELGLDRLPQLAGRRAEYWRWDIIFPEHIRGVYPPRAAKAPLELREPKLPHRCWFVVRQSSTGTSKRQNVQVFDNCRNRSVDGFKTCKLHRTHESLTIAK